MNATASHAEEHPGLITPFFSSYNMEPGDLAQAVPAHGVLLHAQKNVNRHTVDPLVSTEQLMDGCHAFHRAAARVDSYIIKSPPMHDRWICVDVSDCKCRSAGEELASRRASHRM